MGRVVKFSGSAGIGFSIFGSGRVFKPKISGFSGSMSGRKIENFGF